MHKIPTHLEGGPWPMMKGQEGCGMALFGDMLLCLDNHGNAECPFCETIFRRENEQYSIGDACVRCGATVAGQVITSFNEDGHEIMTITRPINTSTRRWVES